MHNFVTREYEPIKARERVDELCIDGVGVMEGFEQVLLGTTYHKEFAPLISFIEHIANGGNPGWKLEYLKNNKGSTEFAFRSKHLRIYAIQEPNKKLLMYGGIKRAADSKDNIAIFRNIKEQYLESLKHNKK